MKKILVLLGAVAFLGCGDGDGSSGNQGATDPTALPQPPGAGAPSAGGGAGAPAPSGSGTDAPPAPSGTQPPGTQPPPGGTDPGVFAGAPAYVAKLGPSTIDLTGKGNGHLSFSATGNPAGRACLDCHNGSGKGGAPAFLFAGTIYADAAGTKVVAKAEVRVVGNDKKAISVYTDENGNFFYPASSGGTVAVPAVAGVRDATAVKSMTNEFTVGNCNQCHGSTLRATL